MPTRITVQMTQQGLLIPHTALGDWSTQELEAVRGKREIVIRTKSVSADVRSRTRQALHAAGMLYNPSWEDPPPVSPEERARLAKKLAQGQPLSEIIISKRDDRA